MRSDADLDEMKDMTPSALETYRRRVLLAVSGLAPQVVTENLYFLCCSRNPPFIPTEIQLITTGRGKELAELGLLHSQQGHYWQFLKDYGLEGQIRFGLEDIHVLRDHQGNILDDLRSEKEMAGADDAIIGIVRTLTSDPNSAFHVSINGGRNAIGVYLGLAMTLFGRPQDRLSQVLVADEFLSNHDFYYPPPEPEVVIGRSNTLVSTASAGITLCEIPLVTLRHGLPETLLSGEASYMETVAAAKRSFAPPKLVIDWAKRKIVCGDQELLLPPQPFAWYAWMARRRASVREYGGHVSWRDEGMSEEFLSEYRHVVGSLSHDYEETARTLSEGMTKEFFDEKKSRVNRWIREELGLGATPYQIQSSGRRPTKRFGLSIPPSQITIIPSA